MQPRDLQQVADDLLHRPAVGAVDVGADRRQQLGRARVEDAPARAPRRSSAHASGAARSAPARRGSSSRSAATASRQRRIDRLDRLFDVRLAAAGDEQRRPVGALGCRARSRSGPSTDALEHRLQLARRAGQQDDDSRPPRLDRQQARRGAVRVVQHDRAARHLRLPPVHLRHPQAAPLEPRLDLGDDRRILDVIGRPSTSATRRRASGRRRSDRGRRSGSRGPRARAPGARQRREVARARRRRRLDRAGRCRAPASRPERNSELVSSAGRAEQLAADGDDLSGRSGGQRPRHAIQAGSSHIRQRAATRLA